MTSGKGSNHKEMTVLYYSHGHGSLPGIFGDESTLVEEHLHTLYTGAVASQKRSKGTWEIKLGSC